MNDVERMLLLLDLKKAIARKDFTKLNISYLYPLKARVDREIKLLKAKELVKDD